ncbi:MAG: ribosome-associated translation inhibitor RaiA [Flavobacteriaceae bacterium]|nr:ribosome-associated translation inhibitor RaiA [Flavobacteriaceae bacterium]
MEIKIQFVKMPTDDKLEAFTLKKLKRLSKKYDWIINVDVFLKEEKDPKGKGKVCEMQLSLYGPRIFAGSNKESFEAAISETINDLEKQLKRRKKEMKPYS